MATRAKKVISAPRLATLFSMSLPTSSPSSGRQRNSLGWVDPTEPGLTEPQQLIARLLWAVETFSDRWPDHVSPNGKFSSVLYLSGFVDEKFLSERSRGLKEQVLKHPYLKSTIDAFSGAGLTVFLYRVSEGVAALGVRVSDCENALAGKMDLVTSELRSRYLEALPKNALHGLKVSAGLISFAHLTPPQVPSEPKEPTAQESPPFVEVSGAQNGAALPAIPDEVPPINCRSEMRSETGGDDAEPASPQA